MRGRVAVARYRIGEWRYEEKCGWASVTLVLVSMRERRCAIRVPGSIEGPRLDSIDSPLVNLVLKGLPNVAQFFFPQDFTAWKNMP
jgi:hypothetical protein